MKIDAKLNKLPFTKTNSKTLETIFGSVDLLPMWVADMDFQINHAAQKVLIDRVTNLGFGYEYKPNSFFVAQKNWYQQHYNLSLEKQNVLYSPSITTTMAILIENFTSEKDGVIIQPPVFMEFKHVIKGTKRLIIKNLLKFDGVKYQIDFADLAEKAALSKNKILIICNPHNPVGRVWSKAELLQIVQICKANDLILISDEIHKDIILFDNQFTSVLHFTDIYEKIIVCTSEAKTFNLCGISDSMVIIPNEELKNSVAKTFKKYNLGRTNALTRVALEASYNHGDAWLKEVLKTVEQNVITIENGLVNSKINLIKPQGTYQVWLDFKNLFSDTKTMFSTVTKKTGIAMNAGHWFGSDGALFMRMNIATQNKNVAEAVKRLNLLD